MFVFSVNDTNSVEIVNSKCSMSVEIIKNNGKIGTIIQTTLGNHRMFVSTLS